MGKGLRGLLLLLLLLLYSPIHICKHRHRPTHRSRRGDRGKRERNRRPRAWATPATGTGEWGERESKSERRGEEKRIMTAISITASPAHYPTIWSFMKGNGRERKREREMRRREQIFCKQEPPNDGYAGIDRRRQREKRERNGVVRNTSPASLPRHHRHTPSPVMHSRHLALLHQHKRRRCRHRRSQDSPSGAGSRLTHH